MVVKGVDLFKGFSDAMSDIAKVELFLQSLPERLSTDPIIGVEFDPLLLTACTYLLEGITRMRAHYEMTRKV